MRGAPKGEKRTRGGKEEKRRETRKKGGKNTHKNRMEKRPKKNAQMAPQPAKKKKP